MKLKFAEWDCIIVPDYYVSNNRKALQLVDMVTEEPIATCTVNLHDIPVNENEILVKDYSENEGMTRCLVEAGIIESEPLSWHNSGFVSIGRYSLTILGKSLFDIKLS